MSEAVIGSVAVDVVPSARSEQTFIQKLRAAILPQAGRLGDEFGVKFGASAGDALSRGIEAGMRKSNPRAQGAKQGDEFGGAFDQAIKERMRKAFASLPKAKVDADLSPAQRRLEQLRTQLGTLGKTFGVHVTDEAALNVVRHLKVELDKLTGPGNDIRVRVDAGAASAELAALQAQLGLVEKQSKRSTDLGLKPMLDAVVLLGPALIPIAGAAIAGGAGLAGMGVAGVLAFKGISREIAANTDAGKQYSAGIALLRGDLASLESVAAKGVLSGFNRAVEQANTDLPKLSGSVTSLSSILGDTAAHTLHGVIGGFEAFSPLLTHVALDVDHLSAKFEAFATGPGGAHFGKTLGAEFDQVIPVLESLALAVGKVVAAFAPVGNEVVGVLGALATTINAIPLPVLQLLAVTFSSLYVANRLKGVFDGISGSLANMALNADGSEKKLGALGTRVSGLSGLASKAGVYGAIAVGILSAASAIDKWIDRNNSEVKVMENSKAAVESFNTALLASKGAVDDAVRSSIVYQLTQDKLSEKAAKAGISQDRLVQAITSSQGSYVDGAGNIRNYTGSLNDLIDTWQATGKPSQDTIKALQELQIQYQETKKRTDEQNAANLALAQSQPDLWRGLATTASTTKTVADMMGLSTDQVTKFAAVLGITQEQVNAGALADGKYSDAVQQVSDAFSHGSASVTTYVAALTTFNASGKGVADTAIFIGASLKAANGDALSFGNSLATAATANLALTNAFSDQADKALASATAVSNAQTALGDASRQASLSVSSAIDQVAASERALTSAQAAGLNAQLALTDARKAAKIQLEDLANQLIDGQLSQRQAVLSLQSAQKALAASPGSAAAQLAVDQAKQQLAEIILSNKRLAEQKKNADKAGIEGSQQVISAQQGIAQATQAIADAQKNLAKSQEAVVTAQETGAKAVAAAQKAVTVAAEAQEKALRNSELAAIDAKTGLIDYSKQGAAPLVQQLQAIQDAAEKAAAATYQHEVATGHATTAAETAVQVYKTQTHDALAGEFRQLGLTKDAAGKLADKYFAMPKDIVTKIQQIGADPLATVLDKLGRLLADLTDHPWDVDIALKFLNQKQNTGEKHGLDNSAFGNVFDFNANGGVKLQHFANGSENHVAQIANAGDWRVWAEPETGGEAYIPLAASKRDRSEAIMAEIARRFGDTYIPGKRFSDGAVMGAAHAAGVTVQQTIVNPIPEPASVSGPAGLRRAALALGA
jgi:hypothetical protein